MTLVQPSPQVRAVLRPLVKVLNPLIVKLAGRRHFGMAAQITHVGRRSGKRYVTPATAHVRDDVILIPLTFGSTSDWSRNVRAAAGCTIRIGGRDYRATSPELLNRAEAAGQVRSMFGPGQRAGMRLLGIRQYLRLHAVPAHQAATAAGTSAG